MVEPITAIGTVGETQGSKIAQPACVAAPLKEIYPRLLSTHETTMEAQKASSVKSHHSPSPVFPALDSSPQTRALGIDIARAVQRNEKMLNEMVSLLVRNIRTSNDVITKLTEEDEKRLNELLAQLARKESSNTVKSLLNIVTSSTAITIGALLLAPETVTAITATAAGAALYSSTSSAWAYLLVASGISNLITNEALPRIGGYEKIASFFTSDDKQREELAENIQITASISNAVMGVISSFATGPLFASAEDSLIGLRLVNTGLELATGSANFIEGANERSYNQAEADRTAVDGKLTAEQFQLDEAHSNLQSATDLAQSFHKTCYNVFQILRRMNEHNTK